MDEFHKLLVEVDIVYSAAKNQRLQPIDVRLMVLLMAGRSAEHEGQSAVELAGAIHCAADDVRASAMRILECGEPLPPSYTTFLEGLL